MPLHWEHWENRTCKLSPEMTITPQTERQSEQSAGKKIGCLSTTEHRNVLPALTANIRVDI